MQKHAMLISRKATDFINSTQIPVIIGDCPLYDQQKKFSGSFPTVGESKTVCFMGIFHIKLTSSNAGGSCWMDLAGSGYSPLHCWCRRIS